MTTAEATPDTLGVGDGHAASPAPTGVDDLTVSIRSRAEGIVLTWTDPNGTPAAGYDVLAVDHYLAGHQDDARRVEPTGYMLARAVDTAVPDGTWVVDYSVINLTTGGLGEVSWPPSSTRVYRAALLRAARWWLVTKAPLGVLEGDLGSVYVSRIDTEISDLLEGLQGSALSPHQEWPTVDAVAAEALNLAGSSIPVSKQAALQSALDAAIEWVTVRAEQSFGVA